MGVFEGLLGGFQARKSEIEAQNYERAQAATQRESQIFESLLGSDDPEIRTLALTGLLDTANPKKRKGGLKGWMGELEQSPYMESMRALINTPVQTPNPAVGGLPPGATPPASGMTLPSRQSAQGVAAPNVQPSIQETPEQAPAAMAAGSPVAPAGSPSAGTGAPPTPTSYTQAPPMPYSLARMRNVFLTGADKVRADTAAKEQGEIEGMIQGLTPAFGQSRAREIAEAVLVRSRTGASAQRYGGTMKGDQIAPTERDAYGRPIDANQHYRVQLQPNGSMTYLPTVAPGVGSAGVEYNRAAIQMGFRNASEVPMERRPELEATAERLTNELRYAGGVGTGQAQIETAQKTLMTPDEAAQLQSRYGITRGQAAELGRIPLTPPQVQAATESYLLDKDIATAKELFTRVWPQVAQPEQRRVALMALQRSQNPDFIQLMSILKRMPLRLAVMTQGSRPSDTDRQVFDSAFPSTAADDWSLVTVPTAYDTGLQLLTTAENLARTSRESIGIIPLAERQQGAPVTPPPAGGPPAVGGAAPTGAAGPGPEWQMINGVIHRNGVPLPQ